MNYSSELVEFSRITHSLTAGLKDAYSELEGAHRGGISTPIESHRFKVNADGKPVQFVLRVDRHEGACGFIFDPMLEASGHCTAADQRRRVLKLIDKVSAHLSLPVPIGLRDIIVPEVLGSQISSLEATQSAIWIAVASMKGQHRLKIYLSLDGLQIKERWRRFGRLLAALGRELSLQAFCSASEYITHQSTPIAIGIDFDGENRPVREKLYVCNDSCGNDWLKRWYRCQGDSRRFDSMHEFQRLCGLSNYEKYYASSFFIGAEFSNSTGQMQLKTDIPVCRWLASPDQTMPLLNRVVEHFDLVKPEYIDYLSTLTTHGRASNHADIRDEVASPSADYRSRASALLQLLGLGFTGGGDPYVNLYIRPPDRRVGKTGVH